LGEACGAAVLHPELDVHPAPEQLAEAMDQVAATFRIEARGENEQGFGVKCAQQVRSAHVPMHQASHLAQHASPRGRDWFHHIAWFRSSDADRHGRESAAADLRQLATICIRERVDKRQATYLVACKARPKPIGGAHLERSIEAGWHPVSIIGCVVFVLKVLGTTP
jgi:hypothetical protein